MRFLKYLTPLAAVLALAGCGGGSSSQQHSSVVSPAPVASGRCVVGNSFMGCSLPAPKTGVTPRVAAPAGRKFVDVSDWQPNVDWRAVRASGVFGVVVKAGEGLHADPTFASHVAGARAAGLQVMAYWFIRPVGCTSEIAAIDHVVSSGMKVVFDTEVPGIAGYVSCLRDPVHSHTGVAPADYTSPGTWPGGSNAGLPLWQAEFGPILHPFWHPVVAWQYTESASVPGIGSSDESIDMGLFPAPTPKPLDIGGAQHYERYPAVFWKISGERMRERNTVMTWDSRGCENPAKRSVCKSTRAHLRTLLGRDQTVYSRETKAQRNANRMPGRIQGLSHRLNNGHGVVKRWL